MTMTTPPPTRLRTPRYRYRLTLRNTNGSTIEATSTSWNKLLDLNDQCVRMGCDMLALVREDNPIDAHV